eukprot:scaffold7773_cov110-Isochrysis_galbana.AAC.8
MAQSLCSRNARVGAGTKNKKDALDRPAGPGMLAGARAANSSAVLNNGVISASWPSTGVEKGSRGSRPKSIVSGLAYWSLGTVSAFRLSYRLNRGDRICTAHPGAG